jgi:signal transduction histidine kinase
MRKPEVVDLNESLRQTAELARHRMCAAEQIRLDLKLSSMTPRVLAHPAALTEAILKLVTNSIDAIAGARSSGTIQITSAVIRNHVVVSVVDDVPVTDSAARLRLDPSQSIIRQIGGDVWVSCGKSRGTTFIIDLPSASLN